MAIPSWPAIQYMPQWSTLTQSTNPQGVLRTEMNSGTTRQRRQYTMAVTTQQIVIEMSNADFTTFQAFFRNTLGDGAARFSMPVWNGVAFVTRNVAIKADSLTDAPIGVTHQKVGMTLLVENLF